MYLCELCVYIRTKPSHQTTALIHMEKTMPPDLHRSSPKLQFLSLFSHILLDLHPENHYSSNPTLLRLHASFYQCSFKCIMHPEG